MDVGLCWLVDFLYIIFLECIIFASLVEHSTAHLMLFILHYSLIKMGESRYIVTLFGHYH